jgi:hypothetical protein
MSWAFGRAPTLAQPLDPALCIKVDADGRRQLGQVRHGGEAHRQIGDARDRLRLGDEVVLFGAQGSDRITQAELEANSSAYGPELLAVLGNSLPKVLKTRPA